MTPRHIPWKALTPFTLAVVTMAVSSCTALTPGRKDVITQSPQNSQLLRTLSTRSDSGYSVAYSPGISKANSAVGEILASAGNKTVKLWNPSAGKLIRTFKHSEPVIALVFSPDGQILASGLDQGSNIRLWNWRTGEIIRIPEDPNSFKMGFDNFKSGPIAFSPDGQNLFARSSSGAASQLWNVSTGKLIRRFDAKSSINAVAISPDGKTLTTGIRDDATKLWNVSTGQLIHTLTGHAGEVHSVAFSPDGKTLASASQDGTIKIWRVLPQ